MSDEPRKILALLVAYQCPNHPEVETLTLEWAAGGDNIGDVYLPDSDPCCDDKFEDETTIWELDRSDVKRLMESLARVLDR